MITIGFEPILAAQDEFQNRYLSMQATRHFMYERDISYGYMKYMENIGQKKFLLSNCDKIQNGFINDKYRNIIL